MAEKLPVSYSVLLLQQKNLGPAQEIRGVPWFTMIKTLIQMSRLELFLDHYQGMTEAALFLQLAEFKKLAINGYI